MRKGLSVFFVFALLLCLCPFASASAYEPCYEFGCIDGSNKYFEGNFLLPEGDYFVFIDTPDGVIEFYLALPVDFSSLEGEVKSITIVVKSLCFELTTTSDSLSTGYPLSTLLFENELPFPVNSIVFVPCSGETGSFYIGCIDDYGAPTFHRYSTFCLPEGKYVLSLLGYPEFGDFVVNIDYQVANSIVSESISEIDDNRLYVRLYEGRTVVTVTDFDGGVLECPTDFLYRFTPVSSEYSVGFLGAVTNGVGLVISWLGICLVALTSGPLAPVLMLCVASIAFAVVFLVVRYMKKW